MPLYRCHKEVRALRIEGVKQGRDIEGGILVVESPFAELPVSVEYMKKHNPQPNGYYVLYEDGYESFSPAKPFEEGYTRIQ
jgi:hypothetical protein